MAIIVEEEHKSSGNWGSIALWVLVFVILAVAVYYIFFRRPELVEVATPQNFENTVQLSKIHLNPDEVINSPQFKALRIYSTSSQVQTSGRANPFLGSF